MAEDLLAEARAELIKSISHLLKPPTFGYRGRKYIHDPIWGTCRFEAWEVTLLEVPLFQRLRGLKQTGFAFQTYPAAEHSRFQHTLGVMTAAGRIFDSLVDRFNEDAISPKAKGSLQDIKWIIDDSRRWRSILRLAAMVHDLGHSFYSHTSERIYQMVGFFPQLRQTLRDPSAKTPGAAEVVTYLIVTSPEWMECARIAFEKADAPDFLQQITQEDWRTIGNWIRGVENDSRKKFLADIISGPLDADKLDYIARDAYFAGLPIGHDLERFIVTACVDVQSSTPGRGWWRLTISLKGINAIEQLVMSRLSLNSYVYHHQKVRASESRFERLLAREYLQDEELLGCSPIWQIFALEDAYMYDVAQGKASKPRALINSWISLLQRQLPIRYLEFRQTDLLNHESELAKQGYLELLQMAHTYDFEEYRRLLEVEDKLLNSMKSAQAGDYIILDVPRSPGYADLENLEFPGRSADQSEVATKILSYRDWIEAYKTHRSYIRLFGPRGLPPKEVFEAAKTVLGRPPFHFDLPLSCVIAGS